jgi:hypothetical protein
MTSVSYSPRAVRRGDEHLTWTSVPLRDALLGDWVLFRRRVPLLLSTGPWTVEIVVGPSAEQRGGAWGNAPGPTTCRSLPKNQIGCRVTTQMRDFLVGRILDAVGKEIAVQPLSVLAA